MNIPITKRWTLQVICWDLQWPWIGCGTWPHERTRPAHKRPLFYSLYVFWLELRWFDNEWPGTSPAPALKEKT